MPALVFCSASIRPTKTRSCSGLKPCMARLTRSNVLTSLTFRTLMCGAEKKAGGSIAVHRPANAIRDQPLSDTREGETDLKME